MAGVGEPFHDRAQALRHAGGRVADAMVIDEEESHNVSVQTVNRHVNNANAVSP
jgi:hypothetical protein